MTTTNRLPEHLHEAYDWTAAAGELEDLAKLSGRNLEVYCHESEQNAQEHGYDIPSESIEQLAEWLRANQSV